MSGHDCFRDLSRRLENFLSPNSSEDNCVVRSHEAREAILITRRLTCQLCPPIEPIDRKSSSALCDRGSLTANRNGPTLIVPSLWRYGGESTKLARTPPSTKSGSLPQRCEQGNHPTGSRIVTALQNQRPHHQSTDSRPI